MQLHSPTTAILAAVIFNALDHRGDWSPSRCAAYGTSRAAPATMLRRNLLVYGLGGIVAPFVGIKIIDLLISFIPGIS